MPQAPHENRNYEKKICFQVHGELEISSQLTHTHTHSIDMISLQLSKSCDGYSFHV